MRRAPFLLLCPAFSLATLFAACSSSPPQDGTTSGSGGAKPSPDAGTGSGGGDAEAGPPEAAPPDGGDAAPPNPFCTALGLPSRPFLTAGTGTARGDVAGDFTLAMVDGTSFTFSTDATGCESYVFLPDGLTVSQTDTTSIWTADLPALLEASPQNVHYFFVSQEGTEAAANTSTQAMQARITALLAAPSSGLSTADLAHWKTHLHVATESAQRIDNWVGSTLDGWGQQGFAIDRRQLLRGVGLLSDVTRQIPDAPASEWPFESNLAYAANEPLYMNAEEDQLDQLDAENATVVPVFHGQILSGDGYATVDMPSAAQMATFDTLEIEVTMQCPDPTELEFNSCGAWDYIAQLYLDTPEADAGPDAGPDGGVTETELGRFITSYHRETHWVEDITPMMVLLSTPGPKALHWSYAPTWNMQPTATTMSLRFSNKKKGYSPSTLTFIAAGGTFDADYNLGRVPVNAPIPADTKHTEVWMIVTGHGSDSYQCGEFCDSEHQFTLNGSAMWLVDFPGAGTESGCIAQQTMGMVPNQGGTWWYGRDGWCPGEQVTPHIWDITSMAAPGGAASVAYQGLFDNTTPPANGSGNIVLTSYVVTFH
jgi:hypothetical protein